MKRWPLLTVLAACSLLATPTAAQKKKDQPPPKIEGDNLENEARVLRRDYRWAIKQYRDLIKRKSLLKRTFGRITLADTRQLGALKTLTASYGKAEKPRGQVRYLIVSIVRRYFQPLTQRLTETATEKSKKQHDQAKQRREAKLADMSAGDRAAFLAKEKADREAAAKRDQELQPQVLPLLAGWRASNKKARDAWLWYASLRHAGLDKSWQQHQSLIQGKDNHYVRIAALVAMARQQDGASESPELAKLVAGILDTLPGSGLQRSLWVEGCATVLLAQKKHLRSAPWKPVCERLIDMLVDPKVLPRSQLALSRHLAQMLDTPNLGFEPRLWKFKLRQQPAPKKSAGPTVSTFFGLQSLGKRICYVIDASDSMMKPLSAADKQRARTLTGPRKKSDKSQPIEKRLPWNKIHNRFDLAREYLKVSLNDLGKDRSFCVILFGKEAKTLKATPKLVKASAGSIKKAIKELNNLKPVPGRALWGETNLHGGMMLAFQVNKGGPISKDDYVNNKLIQHGADTIYLLSDGLPSWDNFGDMDKADPQDITADPESGRRGPDTIQRGVYWGPYGREPRLYMLYDFERLNLFRHAQIHCIGVGEADQHLLQRIADIGMGKAVRVGEQENQ